MIAVIAALALAAATTTARVDAVSVAAAPGAVRVTGELTDEVWRRAAPIDAFVQRDPHDGGEPSQRTEFRVVYDATTLFVKVRAYDTEPDKILTYLTRRDLDSPCDWIHVMIDSYHDRRTAYEFAVNPSGVKVDRYWFNDNSRDDSWDAVWSVSVSRDREGWSAEFRIPFSQLRFTPSASNTFGFAVTRQLGRLNETSTWPLLSRNASGYVSSFGELVGLAMDASPKRLEVVPYTVANLTRQPTDGNPLLKGSAPGGAAGLDLKYALTPGLTLTTTVNPDFGQVEADPAVVNLTAFETFFSERRPFFVEGSGNFNFGLDCSDGTCTGLFYSRRVGRSPQGTDDLPSGDNVYTDTPTQTTILGAGKLTGRVGRYSVGVMQAVTQEARARVQNGPIASTQTVEPLTSYTVGRVRREFANQSSMGFMLTCGEAAPGESAAVPARERVHRRHGLGPALQITLCADRLLGGERRPRRSGRHRAAAGEQSTLLPAARSLERQFRRDPYRALRRRGADRDQQDRRRVRAIQLERRIQESGVRHQRPRVPASSRLAQREQLAPGAEQSSDAVVSQPHDQLQSMGGVELRWRSPAERRQRQCQRGLHQQLVGGRWVRRQWTEPRRSRNAGRAGCGDGGLAGILALGEHRQSAGRLVQLRRQHRRRRPRVIFARDLPERDVPTDAVADGHGGHPVSDEYDRFPVGGTDHRHRRPLRVRPSRPDDGFA